MKKKAKTPKKEMTERQLLNLIGKAAKNPKINRPRLDEDGMLRLGQKGDLYCPMTAAAKQKLGKDYSTMEYVSAGRALGVPANLSRLVAKAADDPIYDYVLWGRGEMATAKRRNDMRAKLAKACGIDLPEFEVKALESIKAKS